MANTIRIKRSSATNAPTTLQNAEIAYSELSDKIFIGVGTGGAGGSATSIVAIGGAGHFLTISAASSTYQTQSGMSSYLTTSSAASTYAPLASPTFTGVVTIPSGASISGYLTTSSASSTYQTISGMSSYLTTATASSTYAPLASPTLTGVPVSTTAAVDTNTTQIATTAYVIAQGYLKSATASSTYQTQAGMSSYLTTSTASSTYQTQSGMSSYLTTSAAGTTYAPLASPTLTGVPLAPTATAGTNTTQIATTAFVGTAVANLVASAPAALDTLNELAAALGNDASFATTIATSLGEKLVKSSNLSDLTSTSTARTNLGLGTMATQAASAVAITGGTINGVTFDGGTF